MGEFKSIDGVSADIYPITGEENNLTNNKWALHVRNLYSASYYDVKMLNKVLREARKKFGGDIHGDYGENRYASLWEDNSTPISRGIAMVYEETMNRLEAVKFSIPAEAKIYERPENNKEKKIIRFIRSVDPMTDLYNALVPFAVSAFEFFFSQIFQVLLKYDDYSKEKIKNHNQKIYFHNILLIKENKKTVEGIIAEQYSFQNLNQINKAFKEWIGIDIKRILFKKRKIGNNVTFLENKILEIIEYRHKIIHHFLRDDNLTREELNNILTIVETAIKEVVIFLEEKYSVKININ